MREALSFLDKAAPSTDFLKHHMREAFESTTQYRHSAWVLTALLILANGASLSLEVHAKEQKPASERTFASPGDAILTLTAPVGDQRRSEQNRVHSPDKNGSTIAKEWPDKWHWSHEGVLYVNGSLVPVNVSGAGAA